MIVPGPLLTVCDYLDLKELAISVTLDPDHKFDLALQLDDLDTALEIVRSIPEGEATTKWKSIGDRALTVWRFDLARDCFEKAGDLSALMLLLLSTGDRNGLQKVAEQAGTSCLFMTKARCLYIVQLQRVSTTWPLLLFCSSGIQRPASTCSKKPGARLRLCSSPEHTHLGQPLLLIPSHLF